VEPPGCRSQAREGAAGEEHFEEARVEDAFFLLEISQLREKCSGGRLSAAQKKEKEKNKAPRNASAPPESTLLRSPFSKVIILHTEETETERQRKEKDTF
jgi:hypothetical protein